LGLCVRFGRLHPFDLYLLFDQFGRFCLLHRLDLCFQLYPWVLLCPFFPLRLFCRLFLLNQYFRLFLQTL
jgi:hypothetical protein